MPVINFPSGSEASGFCGWDLDPGPFCASWADLPAVAQAAAIDVASTLLWAATGRRFGPCTYTVRPCQPRRGTSLYATAEVVGTCGSNGGSALLLGQLMGGNCGCGAGCCCQPACQVVLDGPVASISEVIVDGEVIDSEDYRVDISGGAWYLVRLDGVCWPSCQDFNVEGDDPGGFQVTYARGLCIPDALLYAGALLACDYGKKFEAGECKLPDRLTSLSRQGVTVEVLPSDPNLFATGNATVDAIVLAFNPSRRSSPPIVLSPDLPQVGDRRTVIAEGA